MQFCERLRWWHFLAVFECLVPRLNFGCSELEIVPLVKIGIAAPRARLLAADGWTLEGLCVADVDKLEQFIVKDSGGEK